MQTLKNDVATLRNDMNIVKSNADTLNRNVERLDRILNIFLRVFTAQAPPEIRNKLLIALQQGGNTTPNINAEAVTNEAGEGNEIALGVQPARKKQKFHHFFIIILPKFPNLV